MRKFILTIVALVATCTAFAQEYDEVGDKGLDANAHVEEILKASLENSTKLNKLFGDKDDKEKTCGLVTLDALYAIVVNASELTVKNSAITKAVANKTVTAAQLKEYKNNTVEIAKLIKETPAMVQLVPTEISGLKAEIKAKPTQALKIGKTITKAGKMFKNSKEAIDIIKKESVAQAEIIKQYTSKSTSAKTTSKKK